MANKQIDKVDRDKPYPVTPKLTVPAVAALLQQGYTQAAIARKFFVSRQAVNQFIQSHYDDIAFFANYDQNMADLYKDTARRLVKSLDEDAVKKIPPAGRITSAAICTDKARILEGKSTTNIAHVAMVVEAVDRDIRKKSNKIKHLENNSNFT